MRLHGNMANLGGSGEVSIGTLLDQKLAPKVHGTQHSVFSKGGKTKTFMTTVLKIPEALFSSYGEIETGQTDPKSPQSSIVCEGPHGRKSGLQQLLRIL
jgi:hypothetical protein